MTKAFNHRSWAATVHARHLGALYRKACTYQSASFTIRGALCLRGIWRCALARKWDVTATTMRLYAATGSPCL